MPSSPDSSDFVSNFVSNLTKSFSNLIDWIHSYPLEQQLAIYALAVAILGRVIWYIASSICFKKSSKSSRSSRSFLSRFRKGLSKALKGIPILGSLLVSLLETLGLGSKKKHKRKRDKHHRQDRGDYDRDDDDDDADRRHKKKKKKKKEKERRDRGRRRRRDDGMFASLYYAVEDSVESVSDFVSRHKYTFLIHLVVVTALVWYVYTHVWSAIAIARTNDAEGTTTRNAKNGAQNHNGAQNGTQKAFLRGVDAQNDIRRTLRKNAFILDSDLSSSDIGNYKDLGIFDVRHYSDNELPEFSPSEGENDPQGETKYHRMKQGTSVKKPRTAEKGKSGSARKGNLRGSIKARSASPMKSPTKTPKKEKRFALTVENLEKFNELTQNVPYHDVILKVAKKRREKYEAEEEAAHFKWLEDNATWIAKEEAREKKVREQMKQEKLEQKEMKRKEKEKRQKRRNERQKQLEQVSSSSESSDEPVKEETKDKESEEGGAVFFGGFGGDGGFPGRGGGIGKLSESSHTLSSDISKKGPKLDAKRLKLHDDSKGSGIRVKVSRPESELDKNEYEVRTKIQSRMPGQPPTQKSKLQIKRNGAQKNLKLNLAAFSTRFVDGNRYNEIDDELRKNLK